MNVEPWTAYFASVVLLWGWWKLAFPLRIPALVWVTELAERIVRGDLPQELASLDVFADDKLRMVEDVLRLGSSWNMAYARWRMVSITTGTSATVFGLCSLVARWSERFAGPLALVGVVALLLGLVMLVVEERVRRQIGDAMVEDLNTVVKAWHARLSRTEA